MTFLATALLPYLLAAPLPSPRFCPLELSLREAQAIVWGEITEIVTPRDHAAANGWTEGGRYRLRADQVERGPVAVGERILVNASGDWTCEARNREYAAGQRLLLFLRREEHGAWSPCFGFQSERELLEGGILDEPHVGIDPTWRATEFLAGLGKLVRFVEAPREREGEAWLGLLRDENPEVRRFGQVRIADYSMIRYAISDEGGTLTDLPVAQRRSLWEAVLAQTGAGVDAAPRDALVALFESFAPQDRAAFVAEARSVGQRLEAAGGPRDLCAAARLGNGAVLLRLLALLGTEEHHVHDDVLEALLGLHAQEPLPRPEVLDLLAAHPVASPCEYRLGALAVELLGADLAPDVSGVSRTEWGRRFREWWQEHRDEVR